ncbi:hypothetical protein BHM03_00047048, partial [Ensete ventricosum]
PQSVSHRYSAPLPFSGKPVAIRIDRHSEAASTHSYTDYPGRQVGTRWGSEICGQPRERNTILLFSPTCTVIAWVDDDPTQVR